MEKFLEINGFKKDVLDGLLEQCFLNSLFEELIKYIEKNNLSKSIKLRLQNSYNEKEELYILEDLINEFSNVVLLNQQLEKMLHYLKAYYNKSRTRSPLPIEIKELILEKQNHKCILCGSNINIKNAHFDHVIAFKFVGDELESNFQALCPTCNLQKNANSFYCLKLYLLKPKRK